MDDLIQACIESDTLSQRIDVTLNSNHPLFEEHFPGSPTLPGALTISMLIDFSRQFFEENKIVGFSLAQIERVSFIKRIHPSGHYHFWCNYKPDNGAGMMRLAFAALDSDNLKIEYARGVLVYKKMGY